MLDRPGYAQSWEWKRNWYERNGFHEGVNLFTTSEVNGLNTDDVRGVADLVRLRSDERGNSILLSALLERLTAKRVETYVVPLRNRREYPFGHH